MNGPMAMMVYGFTGQYAGGNGTGHVHLEPGSTHRCLLFLLQPGAANLDPVAARRECARFGFPAVEFDDCGPLDVEVLNTERFRDFAPVYEQAQARGSALLVYPL
jgi:hypothetical protein